MLDFLAHNKRDEIWINCIWLIDIRVLPTIWDVIFVSVLFIGHSTPPRDGEHHWVAEFVSVIELGIRGSSDIWCFHCVANRIYDYYYYLIVCGAWGIFLVKMSCISHGGNSSCMPKFIYVTIFIVYMFVIACQKLRFDGRAVLQKMKTLSLGAKYSSNLPELKKAHWGCFRKSFLQINTFRFSNANFTLFVYISGSWGKITHWTFVIVF